jgi:hypothetical protein
VQKNCLQCQTSFEIHPDEAAFVEKMAYTFGGKKFALPQPVFCPECRLRNRTCHRNERNMYRRTSSLSGRDIVSLFPEEPLWGEPYIVYTPDEWNADSNDFTDRGRTWDPSKPFFAQCAALHKAVPRMALTQSLNENCDFSTGTGYCKNCYLINSSEYCEDCYYGKLFQSCKSSVDCSYLYGSELCYECFSVYDSYNCRFVSFSKNCRDCSFSTDLIGCRNCCLCSNLRQKEYHFLNKPLSKAEYEQKVREFQGSWKKTEEMQRQLDDVRHTMVHRAANVVNSEDCTGDYIENSQRCFDCYDVNDSQDCRYVTVGVNVKDNYDCSNMYIKPELGYETLGTLETYHTAYCLFVFNCQNLLYCQYCWNCSDCFGCDGLRRKKYCILNKQYSKEEYEQLVPRIIEKMKTDGEWGKFYPPTMSPYGYNESVAHEYLPLTEAEAKKRGFLWRNITEKKPSASRTVNAADLPDRIEDVPDDVLNWAIECTETKRPFKIIKQELDFYRRQSLPLPRVHPDVRYDRRLALRNPRQLWERNCMKCGAQIQSTYAPDRPETIYCEKCYLKEVY